jgi:integrase
MNGPRRRPPAPLWRDDIEGFTEYLRLLGRAEQTIWTRRHHLIALSYLTESSPQEVTTSELLAYIGRSSGRETKKSRRASLTGFFAWLTQTGRRDDDPSSALPKFGAPRPHPKPCPDVYIERALEKASDTERLMLLLASECGLRRGEIAQVHSDDVLQDHEGNYSLIVHGKGDKQRIVPLPESLGERVANTYGWLFPGRYTGHVEVGYISRHLTRLLPEGYSAHKLRHRFATVSYEATSDMLAVSKALGHENIETTMHYVALPDKALRPLVESATLTTEVSRQHTEPIERDNRNKPVYKQGEYKAVVREAAGAIAVELLKLLLCPDIRTRSFRLHGDVFALEHKLPACGHVRLSSPVRAGALLLQSWGLVDTLDMDSGEIGGNLVADADDLMNAIQRLIRPTDTIASN